MKLVAITGNTGTGKTFFTKTQIIKKFQKVVIFDINNEYKDVSNSVRFFETDPLIKHLSNNTNCLVVIDEATAFFSYRTYSNELNKLLQLRRHKNHYFVFIYHSIDFIPLYLLRYINYLVVFQQNATKTNVLNINVTIPKEKFKFNLYKIM